VAYLIEDKNNIPYLKAELDFLLSHRLEIGIFGKEGRGSKKRSELLIYASVHEFGCVIKITKKMRGYLWSQGMKIGTKKDKIVIPERSFMRSGFDENLPKIEDMAKKLVLKVLEGKGRFTAEFALSRMGAYIVSLIQAKITDGTFTPLHPYTIAHKKDNSTKPLIDSGRMKNSITWRIVSIKGGS
jgi:hypothetical protein